MKDDMRILSIDGKVLAEQQLQGQLSQFNSQNHAFYNTMKFKAPEQKSMLRQVYDEFNRKKRQKKSLELSQSQKQGGLNESQNKMNSTFSAYHKSEAKPARSYFKENSTLEKKMQNKSFIY